MGSQKHEDGRLRAATAHDAYSPAPLAMLRARAWQGRDEAAAFTATATAEGARVLPRFLEHPGEHSLAEHGTYFPVINRNRCEGSGECMRICPQKVFEVRTIEAEDHDMLSFVGRVRSAIHGRQTAYTPHASACDACGLCLEICAEDAIQLVTLF